MELIWEGWMYPTNLLLKDRKIPYLSLKKVITFFKKIWKLIISFR